MKLKNQQLTHFYKRFRKLSALIIISWAVSLLAYTLMAHAGEPRIPTVADYDETGSSSTNFATWIPTSTFLNWSHNIGPYLDNDNYFMSGFTCTGSMLPLLDCGDEAIFLRPPFPRHLSVKDVISFTYTNDCHIPRTVQISKAHRIVDINFHKNTRVYITRGDANNAPDPCQVTNSHINGVLIGIKKGSRPKDVRNSSEFHVLKLTIIELDRKYDKLLQDFKSQISEHEIVSEHYQNSLQYYTNGQVSYEDMLDAYNLLNKGLVSLYDKRQTLDNLSANINLAISERDRLYTKLLDS